MPELPDVEVFRRRLAANGLNRTVETVSVRPAGMTVTASASTIREALRGHRLTKTHRHGKHLFVRSGEARHRWLRLHFGMTGSLDFHDRTETAEPEHTRLRLDFRGRRSLAYRCPRKFGEMGLVEDPAAFAEARSLGVDLLDADLDADGFADRLRGVRGSVKAALMKQERMAGLGNVYADEALFQAGLHPDAVTADLEAGQLRALWRTVRSVLHEAVDREADPGRMPGSWLLPRREEGRDCPRCRGSIVRIEVSGRSTYLCNRHQRPP